MRWSKSTWLSHFSVRMGPSHSSHLVSRVSTFDRNCIRSGVQLDKSIHHTQGMFQIPQRRICAVSIATKSSLTNWYLKFVHCTKPKRRNKNTKTTSKLRLNGARKIKFEICCGQQTSIEMIELYRLSRKLNSEHLMVQNNGVNVYIVRSRN